MLVRLHHRSRKTRFALGFGLSVVGRCLIAASFLWFPFSNASYAQLGRVDANVDTVLVCAPDLLPAAREWIEYRSKQGHRIAVIGSGPFESMRRSIQSLSRKTQLKFVVLMGDAPVDGEPGTSTVATQQVEATVIRQWGAEPVFVSDNALADIDDDGSPDLAVGRISADDVSELSSIIAKIIAYETDRNVGLWRRRVNLVAGVGGFGIITDKILETAAKKFITDGIPAEFQTSMTQASWRSPYSPDPRLFQAQTIERMNEGCLAWVYLGHGRTHELDYYRVPDGGLPILSVNELRHVASRAGSPIAVFLSCYAGAFGAEPDCLAEQLLARRGGPVAVIAGSSVTMPYAMTVMGNAMLHELFVQRRATLGEVMLHAKRELGNAPAGPGGQLIDQIAAALSPNSDQLVDERREHIRLFHLLGDPLLRIRHASAAHVEAPEYATAGEEIEITASSLITGPCMVELVCRRDRLTFTAPRRPRFEVTDSWLNQLQATYAQANNSTWVALRQQFPGDSSIRIQVPPNASGPAHVRIFVQGANQFAMGSADVYIQPPARDDDPNRLSARE